MVSRWLTIDENDSLERSRNAFEKLDTVERDFEQYKAEYSTPNTEVERLQKFEREVLAEERNEAEFELFEKFDESLGLVDDYIELKEKSKDYSLEEIETKCLVMYAKATMGKTTFSTKPNKNVRIPAVSEGDVVTPKVNPYGDLFEKFGK